MPRSSVRLVSAAFLLLLLGACQSPQSAWFMSRAEPRIAFTLEDAGEAAWRLEPEVSEAYRKALESRFKRHLATGDDPTATFRITFHGLRPAGTEPRGAGVGGAALTGSPVLLALSLASLGSPVRRKLGALGYPIQVPDATLVILPPPDSPRWEARSSRIEESRIILAHEPLMHGDRNASSLLRAEAEAFARAVESHLKKELHWPPAGK